MFDPGIPDVLVFDPGMSDSLVSAGRLLSLQVIPDVLVFDPGMSDSLVSAGRLMEVDYGVIFRTPLNAVSDRSPSAQFQLYGGSVTTSDGSTVIVME